MTIDFDKALRQLKHAQDATRSAPRLSLVLLMTLVYENMRVGKNSLATAALQEFDDEIAQDYGWSPNTGAAMPRPFSHPHLERVYWQARRQLNGTPQPPRVWKPPAKFMAQQTRPLPAADYGRLIKYHSR